MAVTVQFDIDEEVRTQAAQIYEQLGLDLQTALTIFLKRSVAEKGLPFSMNISDNAQTSTGDEIISNAELEKMSDMIMDKYDNMFKELAK